MNIGHNSLMADTFDVLKDECQELVSIAYEWDEASDDTEAAQVAALSDRILKARKSLDAARVAEKAPFVIGGRAVDARYNPVLDDLSAAQRHIKGVLLARVKEKPIPDMSLDIRKPAVRVTWKAEVADLDAAISRYRDHPEMISLLNKLASAEARAGAREIPGFLLIGTESIA